MGYTPKVAKQKLVTMSKKAKDIFQFLALTAILLLVNVIGQQQFWRFDLTTEKRYSLSPATKAMLEQIDDRVLFTIYLDGEFPAGFKRLQRETRQMLDEFRAYNRLIEYRFENPASSESAKERREVRQQLEHKGLEPVEIEVAEKEGMSRKMIFPGAVVSFGTNEMAVSLLANIMGADPERQINSSVQNLEYTLASAIRTLTLEDKPRIAILSGHGQLDDRYLEDIVKSLNKQYSVVRLNLREFPIDTLTNEPSIERMMWRLNSFKALIMAKPQKTFTDLDKLFLDQYIMNGGKMVWLLDAVAADQDSLSYQAQFLALPLMDKLGLGEMLFRYGVRINTDLVQDLVAAGVNDRKAIRRWVYFPVAMPTVKHPITKDLNAVKFQYASSIDTIRASDVKKTVLLHSSQYAKRVSTPHSVSLALYYNQPPEASFTQGDIPLAVLLEGEFDSYFKNRLTQKMSSSITFKVKDKSKPTQMLVVGDGDIIKNQLNLLNPNLKRGEALPLGYDQFTNTEFGNKDFLLNALDCMLDEKGLITVRSRELKIRLLDYNRIKENRTWLQVFNIGFPILLTLIFGGLYTAVRKRKYTK